MKQNLAELYGETDIFKIRIGDFTASLSTTDRIIQNVRKIQEI